MKRVSIFLPSETPFYAGLLAQMRRGFEACGVETSGALGHLGPDDLRRWCAEHRPQAIVEMNRPARDAHGLPNGVRHVVWVVDFDGRGLEHFEGSDVTLLFGPSWVERYPYKAGLHRWFGPGACPRAYPRVVHTPEVEASFVGYIPWPWSQEDRARNVTGGPAAYTFGELLPEFEHGLRDARNRLRTADDFIEIAERVCRAACGQSLQLDDRLRCDLTRRAIRAINRTDLVDAALGGTRSLALYGPQKWRAWPRYAPYYRGWLDTPQAMHGVYRRSAVNLHEGNGVHFRSMDVMSTGGLLFFRETAHDGREGGMLSYFQPFEHFVPFTLDNLGDRLTAMLDDPSMADKIRRAAADEIRARHTWHHRARSILDDLAAVG